MTINTININKTNISELIDNKKTTTYDVGYQGLVLGQPHKYGDVKPINRTPLLITGSPTAPHITII